TGHIQRFCQNTHNTNDIPPNNRQSQQSTYNANLATNSNNPFGQNNVATTQVPEANNTQLINTDALLLQIQTLANIEPPKDDVSEGIEQAEETPIAPEQ
ncbi:7246_t:CDS:2, partial [Ambispora leptoticha]